MTEPLDEVLVALRDATPFAETILRRQCERLGHTPESLPPADVPQLLNNVRIVMRSYLDPFAFGIFEDRMRRLTAR